MTTQDYLDQVRRSLGLPSDYALQKPLQLSKGQISNYRTGRETFSNKVAVRIAKLVGENPLKVIAEVNLQRAEDPEERAVWAALLEKISKGFETLMRRSHPRWA